MKRTMMILLAILMMLSVCMTTCAESGKRVAKDGAQMQTDDPTMPTRLPPENGTKILLHRPGPDRQAALYPAHEPLFP